MLSFFTRRKASPISSNAAAGFFKPESPDALLSTSRRRQLIENIWQRTSLPREQFETLYMQAFKSYAALVQHLPASENHHHAYHGGMLDHGLEIVAYALKIRQMYLLPIGAPPESQAAQSEAWSAASAYGALVHDLGKIAVDVKVELADGTIWHPWHGPMDQPYRFKYVKGRDYRLHGAASSLIYSNVIPAKALDWLSGFPELWSQLVFAFAGQYEHADILGEIVSQADQASVAQELGGNPGRAMSAPKQSIQRQLAEGLRMLVADKFKLNQPDGPSDGWLTQEGLWLVSKPAVDQLRALLLSQGIEHVPSSNAPMFDLLQDQAIIQPNGEGKAIWKASIDNGRGWKNTFTVLKIAPALIWPNTNDRPETYTGTLTVESAPMADDNESAPAGGDESQPVNSKNTPEAPAARPAPKQAPAAAKDFDALDELLDLFPDPVATAPTQPTPEPAGDDDDDHDDQIPFLPPPPAATRLSQPRQLVGDKAENHTALVEEPAKVSPEGGSSHGLNFLTWLKGGVISHRIIINDAKARVHTVDGTAFLVSPDIFKRYALEHPDIGREAKERDLEAWQVVQRSFEKLKKHRKTGAGLNIWTCLVKGPRKSKQLRGYLLIEPTDVFSEVPYDNPVISLAELVDKDTSE
ncbi:integrating conjugative element relaxase [Pseudomonas syringae]|uniref:MobH family relaxase n=1 Tax=Pseudomonas TaxID=286 RepID=UPI000885B758|nr:MULTISPECIES: MobH family relaxase [Pseudomonas]NAP06928.1 integrating conjugative element relaxase [Pseudomonas syringae]NAP26605.1 integrating conjugative element relaxase [Pseudomonas syringae]NAP50105.1 integrating conjugative element relaxase [Pseudomonas syringae]NAP86372.1 integrating conjugative element relaxase [Pseudomonas syringae]RXU03173.1 integrating conjugative element relaxase [Pseudomonas syringae]